MDAQTIETLYLSAISLAELRFGIAALPPGKRRDTLHSSLEQRIVPLFADRILPFDAVASEAYAVLRARARAQGKTIAYGLIVATRDTGPFKAAGVTVIDPWNTQH